MNKRTVGRNGIPPYLTADGRSYLSMPSFDYVPRFARHSTQDGGFFMNKRTVGRNGIPPYLTADGRSYLSMPSFDYVPRFARHSTQDGGLLVF